MGRLKLQMLCIAILFIANSIHHCLYSQVLHAINDDGEVLVTVDFLGDSNLIVTQKANYGVETKSEVVVKNFLITVFDLRKNNITRKIRFDVKEKSQPDSLVVAPHGQNFYLRFRNHYFVFNARSGRLIGNYYYPSNRDLFFLAKHSGSIEEEALNQKVIAFPYNDNMYVVRNSAMLVYYDGFTGTPIDTCTGFSRNADLKEIYFSKDDNYLVAQDTKKRFYIWKTGISKILLRTFSDEVKFSPDIKKLFTLQRASNNFHLIIYKLPELDIIRHIRKNTLQEFYPPPKRKGIRTITYYPGKNTDQKYVSLSNSGSYLLYSFEYDRLSDYYMFMRTDTFSLETHFDEIKLGRKGRSCNWISDNKLEVVESDFVSRLYPFPSVGQPYLLNYRCKFNQSGLDPSIIGWNLENTGKVNSQRTFKAFCLNIPGETSSLVMTTSALLQKSIFIKNYSFVDFTTDGKSAIFISSSQIPVKINLIELFNRNGDIERGRLAGFNTQSKIIKENWIRNDSKPPSTYKYFRFDTITPIYKIIPDEEIHILQKSIAQSGSKVSLQVHLMDNSGRYYSEATRDGAKDIWCGLFVRKPDSTIEKIEHFEVVEFNDDEKQKDAIALVLDHSGSMGMERSLDIEKSARDFIQLKNKDDAIALVKYDDWIGVESYLTSNARILLDSLKMYGIRGYGGNTALLDAINTGIFLLKNEHGYNRKAVVLMTDGMENSSGISKNKVLQRALENNISIFTIGFGNKIDDNYLKALSARTGGSYYQLYNSRDLRWIFNDIYKKINNYYEIRFDLTTIGIHQVVLKLCYENSKPLITTFDNTPLPPVERLDTTDFELSDPVQERIYDSVIIDEPEFEVLSHELPPVPLERIRQNFTIHNDTLDILTEFNYIEFPNIRFEFDKTVVIPGTDNGLSNVVDFLNKYPQVNIEIIGHTDSIGSIEYNIDLSVRRAKKVKQMLIDRGVDKDRIYISGKGESQPALANNNFWRRTYNRRVEFRLIFPQN